MIKFLKFTLKKRYKKNLKGIQRETLSFQKESGDVS